MGTGIDRRHGPRIRSARMLACAVVTIVFMWHMLKHTLLQGGKPIDYTMLVIESLVLALIAYEVTVGIQERHKKKRRTYGH